MRIAIFATAVGASLLFAVLVARPAATQLTNGFSAYDTSARLVVEGANPAHFYDDEWFRLQTIRLGFGAAQDIYNVNPPAAALLMVPLAGLSPLAGKEVWTGLNLAFLAIALAVLARICHWTPPAIAGAVVLVAAFEPAQEEIHFGQAYALLLVLEALLAWAYLGRRDRWIGGILAGLLGFKAALLALPALLIAQRQWRALIAGAIALAAIVGLTIPVVGWAAWSTYVQLLFDLGGHREIAVTAYQSVPSLVFHLLRRDPIPYKSPRLAAGAWAILAYPNLYGGLLLWWLALRRLRELRPTARERVAAVASRPLADF